MPVFAGRVFAKTVDRPVPSRGDDPSRWAGRYARSRPALDRGRECLLDRVFGDVDIAKDAGQDGDRATVLLAEHPLDVAGRGPPAPGAAVPVPGGAPPPPGAAVPVPGAAAPVPGAAAPAPGAAAPVPGAAAPVPGAAAPVPGAAAPVPGAAAPVPGAAAPVPGAAAPVPGAAAPVPGAAAPAPGVAAPAPGAAAPAPGVAAPVSARWGMGAFSPRNRSGKAVPPSGGPSSRRTAAPRSGPHPGPAP